MTEFKSHVEKLTLDLIRKDIEVKNASGDLSVFSKHADMIKYYTMSLELATPDPALEPQAVRSSR